MAERADEYQNKSFLSQTNGRTHEAKYGDCLVKIFGRNNDS